MAHAIIIITQLLALFLHKILPCAAVVGCADGSAIRLYLHDFPGKINIGRVFRIPFHIQAKDVQVRQVSGLLGYVTFTDFPCILMPQIPCVSTGFVNRCLPVFTRETAVCHKLHLFERVERIFPTV